MEQSARPFARQPANTMIGQPFGEISRLDVAVPGSDDGTVLLASLFAQA